MNASLEDPEISRAYDVLGLDRNAALKTLNTLLRLTALGNSRFQKEDVALAKQEAAGSFPHWMGANLDNLVARAAPLSEEWRFRFLSTNATLLDVANRPAGNRDSSSILGRHSASVIKGNSDQNWTRKQLFTLDTDDVIAIGASNKTATSSRHIAWEPVIAIMAIVAVHNTLYPELQLSAAAALRVAELQKSVPDIKPAAKIFCDRDLDGRIARLAHRPDFKELVRQAVEVIEKKTL